jgi:deoxyribonuclease (pyrimidine dimer)
MTRVNVGILPEELPNKLLIGEHREIKRIPNAVRSGRFSLANQPKLFTLGKGHVKFFYDKLLFLRNRYESLYGECLKRGFNVTNFSSAWDDVPQEYLGDYVPTHRDRLILLERIASRGFVLGVR